MNELTIIKQNGGAYIDSRQVAEYIGKRHDNLLRDIAKYRDVMACRGLLKIEESDFFVESSYVNAQNKVMPCYLISKMACELIANKLTGDKGIMFTIAYVRKFNDMEKRERAELEKQAATPRLKVFNSAVRNVMGGFAYTRSSPNCVMNFLRGAYQPFGIEVTEQDGYSAHTLSATDIAAIYGVYSESGRPHAHAVAAIIERLNIAPEHIAVVPFSLVGVAMRYDFHVYRAVGDWLIANNYPHSVPHLDFAYHIYYDRQLSLDDYTDAELDELCGHFGDCDDCPGFRFCCEKF